VQQAVLEEAIEPTDLTAEMPCGLTLTVANVSGVLEALADYHAQFAPLFRRSAQRQWAQVYLQGLLTADVVRKNVEARYCASMVPGLVQRIREDMCV